MKADVELQIATVDQEGIPTEETLVKWAQTALETGGRDKDAELTVRIVERDEIKA